MALPVRLSARRYRESKGRKCDICSKKFVRIEEMKKHRRGVQPDMSPREAES